MEVFRSTRLCLRTIKHFCGCYAIQNKLLQLLLELEGARASTGLCGCNFVSSGVMIGLYRPK